MALLQRKKAVTEEKIEPLLTGHAEVLNKSDTETGRLDRSAEMSIVAESTADEFIYYDAASAMEANDDERETWSPLYAGEIDFNDFTVDDQPDDSINV